MTNNLKLFAVSSYYGNYHEVAAPDSETAYDLATHYFDRHHMGMVVAVQEIADRTAPIVKPEVIPGPMEWVDLPNPMESIVPVHVRFPKLGWPIDPWLDNWIKEQIKIAHETIRDKPDPKET